MGIMRDTMLSTVELARIGGRNALEPFLLEIGEGAHLALLDVEGALHTAADLCEVGFILCNRHHGQRHHGNRFAPLGRSAA